MHSISSLPAFYAAKVFHWSKYKCLLDIGGGSGIYSISIVKQNSEMKAIVYDTANVLESTKNYIKSYDVEDKVMTWSGDMFSDVPYPIQFHDGTRVDVVFLSQILHDWTIESGYHLLQKAYDMLPPEGIIVINEKLLNDDRSGPTSVAMVNIDMLFMCDGQQYSFAKLSEMLQKVGFKDPQQVKTVQYWSMTYAKK